MHERQVVVYIPYWIVAQYLGVHMNTDVAEIDVSPKLVDNHWKITAKVMYPYTEEQIVDWQTD